MYLNVSVFGIIQGGQEHMGLKRQAGVYTHRYTHHDRINLACLRNEAKKTLECESRSNMALTVKFSMILLTLCRFFFLRTTQETH